MEKWVGVVGIRKLMENTIPATAAGVSGTANLGAAANSPDLTVKADRLYRWVGQIHDRVMEFPNHPELWARALRKAQALRQELEAARRAAGLLEFGVEEMLWSTDMWASELGPWAWAGYHPGLQVPWWRWRLRSSSLQGR